jgi:hypothetical protein
MWSSCSRPRSDDCLYHLQYSCGDDDHHSALPEIVQVVLLSPEPTPFRPRNKGVHHNASKTVKIERNSLTPLEQEALAALQEFDFH